MFWCPWGSTELGTETSDNWKISNLKSRLVTLCEYRAAETHLHHNVGNNCCGPYWRRNSGRLPATSTVRVLEVRAAIIVSWWSLPALPEEYRLPIAPKHWYRPEAALEGSQ